STHKTYVESPVTGNQNKRRKSDDSTLVDCALHHQHQQHQHQHPHQHQHQHQRQQHQHLQHQQLQHQHKIPMGASLCNPNGGWPSQNNASIVSNIGPLGMDGWTLALQNGTIYNMQPQYTTTHYNIASLQQN